MSKIKQPILTFEFDILCLPDMIERFMSCYSPFYQNNSNKKQKVSDNKDEKQHNFYELIKKIIIDEKWTELKDNNMFGSHKYGSELTITYSPLSQRYIDLYDEQSFNGILFYGDIESDNALLFYRQNSIIYVKSLERDGCHYMGMSRGYIYFINGR